MSTLIKMTRAGISTMERTSKKARTTSKKRPTVRRERKRATRVLLPSHMPRALIKGSLVINDSWCVKNRL